jgi:uncharacterized protein (TIGR04255 family)
MTDESGPATASDDLFPQSPRVLYAKAPLVQVVSDLRFPPILKIASGPPADFQERIRGTYPLFATVPNLSVPQLPQMPALEAEILKVIGPQLGGVIHQFQTEDQKSTITLTTSSLSLMTTDYKMWEDFRQYLAGPLAALEDIYERRPLAILQPQ